MVKNIKTRVTTVASRNAKWLRKRSGVVKKRNNKIRLEYFKMIERYTDRTYIVTFLQKKYGVCRQTVYNAVNNYYR